MMGLVLASIGGGGALALILTALWLRFSFARLTGMGQESDPPVAEVVSPLVAQVAALALPQDRSGFTLLHDGVEAFAARLALIRAARRSLDLQYYHWASDDAGHRLLHALQAAAERGVRIRLLIDDFGAQGLDAALVRLAAQPGVAVRLFNPALLRRWRNVNLALDFGRLNRRMHNKALVADGQCCILGGRNIADEYFAGSGQYHFIDFDVFGVGPVGQMVIRDFERYWTAGAAIPVRHLLTARPAMPEPPRNDLPAGGRTPVDDLLAGTLDPAVAEVEVVSDDPEKVLGRAGLRRLAIHRISELLIQPETSLDIVSAYFVPGGAGLRRLQALARRGVRVRILTNGQQSTDVTLVHCGYARYRRRLLMAGVRISELKGGEGVEQTRRRLRDRMRGTPSHNSLHAKTFVVDEKRLFVGSFNLDQRSMYLNTEIGLIIDAPDLAAEFTRLLEAEMRQSVYRLDLRETPRGRRLIWREDLPGGGTVEHDRDPGTSALSRLLLRLAGRLPIEWLL
ncbi:phospholipase D-like domain-containing protein [Gemmobacter lutimaris]|nr:phospholipase D family protein [Gemmobacter lutimaris]